MLSGNVCLLFMKKIHVITNTVPETEVRGILWLILTKPKCNHDSYIQCDWLWEKGHIRTNNDFSV